MIKIQTQKYAENEKEFLASLFSLDGTCCGYAKRNKYSITFYNIQHNPVGILTEYGVFARITISPTGEKWYSYGAIDGFPNMTCLEKSETCEKLAIDARWKNGEVIYIFT